MSREVRLGGALALVVALLAGCRQADPASADDATSANQDVAVFEVLVKPTEAHDYTAMQGSWAGAKDVVVRVDDSPLVELRDQEESVCVVERQLDFPSLFRIRLFRPFPVHAAVYFGDRLIDQCRIEGPTPMPTLTCPVNELRRQLCGLRVRLVDPRTRTAITYGMFGNNDGFSGSPLQKTDFDSDGFLCLSGVVPGRHVITGDSDEGHERWTAVVHLRSATDNELGDVLVEWRPHEH